MMSYQLEPNVAGALGERTVEDRSQHPPLVQRVHFELDDWLGDDLLEVFPVHLATTRLQRALEGSGLTGFDFADVEVTASDNFRALGLGPVPDLTWMKVNGAADADDFWLSELAELRVSERAMAFLRSFNLEHCVITSLD